MHASIHACYETVIAINHPAEQGKNTNTMDEWTTVLHEQGLHSPSRVIEVACLFITNHSRLLLRLKVML